MENDRCGVMDVDDPRAYCRLDSDHGGDHDMVYPAPEPLSGGASDGEMGDEQWVVSRWDDAEARELEGFAPWHEIWSAKMGFIGNGGSRDFAWADARRRLSPEAPAEPVDGPAEVIQAMRNAGTREHVYREQRNQRTEQLRAAMQALAAAEAARDEALEINRHHERNDHYLSTDIPQLDNPMTIAGIKEAFEYGGEKCTCVCCDHVRHLVRLVGRAEAAEAKLAEVEKANQWTSVNHGFPETGAPCWVIYSGHVQLIAYKRIGIGFACAGGYEWTPAIDMDADPMPDEFVTHWRLVDKAQAPEL